MIAQTCPVCGGNGLVPNGFYNQVSGQWTSSSLEPEKCRSCDGTGVVWYDDNILLDKSYSLPISIVLRSVKESLDGT